jgi:hypothetical protein
MLHSWWASLSGEARAAIIAAIVGPIVSAFLGLSMRRFIYIWVLERLDDVQKQQNSKPRWGDGKIIDVDDGGTVYPMDFLARQAKIPLRLAKLAIKWKERRKKYG